jgi:hypothetical protein
MTASGSRANWLRDIATTARRRPLLALAIVLVSVTSLGVPSLTIGQTGSRQSASNVFDQQLPAHSTGTRLAIDYVNPDDPQAKPRAVKRVVIALAPGTTIDTSVPARCGASDLELMANGAAACPAGSRVGGGEIDLDTGLPGPARVLQNDVILLNNTGELILLLESKSDPSSRVVARSVVNGATITSDVAAVPGGPPDGFTAIKRVRLTTEARSTAGRSYVATPASCPRSHVWTNTLTFTYRDDVSQTVRSASPCRSSRRPPR